MGTGRRRPEPLTVPRLETPEQADCGVAEDVRETLVGRNCRLVTVNGGRTRPLEPQGVSPARARRLWLEQRCQESWRHLPGEVGEVNPTVQNVGAFL